MKSDVIDSASWVVSVSRRMERRDGGERRARWG